MRLTLRTLLAYLDDILETEDRDDIGGKVRESEFATALVHRVRDVSRRMRLGAPQLLGTGMGRDPNSVAEYLDNTLAAEQVQLFEKVCLESDVHLAEVGSCHHILTMILGEPAHIDTESREQMYRLIELAAERAAADEAAAAAAPLVLAPDPRNAPHSAAAIAVEHSAETSDAPIMATVASAPLVDDPSHPKPAVPDYLRGSSASRVQTIVLTVAVAALATAVVLALIYPQKIYRALGWNTKTDQVATGGSTETGSKTDAGRSGDRNPSMPHPIGGSATGGTVTQPPQPITLPPVDLAPLNGNAGTAGPPATSGPATTGPATTGPATGTAGKSPNALDSAAAKTPLPPAPGPVPLTTAPPVAGAPITGTPPATIPPPATIATPIGGTSAPGASPPGPPAAVPGKGPDLVASLDAKLPPPGVTTTAPPKGTATDAAVPPAPASPATALPVTVGRLLSDGQVLLRNNKDNEIWERLAPQAPLATGDRLLVLPGFRPIIGISGVSIEMDGGTQIELLPADKSGAPQVVVSFGRLTVRTVGQPNARVHLRAGDADGVLSFGDGDSTLAVEVRPRHTPGTDPAQIPSMRQVTLYAASGKITWTTADKTLTLQGPARLTLAGTPVAGEEKNGQLPRWILAAESAPLDARGVQRIEQVLSNDRTVKLRLVEQAAQQRVEVRNLATRCCAYIGHFEPLVKGLSDEEQRAAWMMYVTELRDAAARDPATAVAVRATFEKVRGDQAQALYRMLWGYTAQGLTNGDARQLVKYLDHEELVFRVMSFWNLQDITDMELYYRPENSAAKRKQSIIRWQKRLEERKIVPSATSASGA